MRPDKEPDMKKMKIQSLVFILLFILCSRPCFSAETVSVDAQALVEKGFNYWRGKASVFLLEMTIHRPDWQRTVTLKGWTRGDLESLFTIIAPARDRGNGTLKNGRKMWMFNPKVNRVIKLPPSMMSQSWMGSDFSNNDLAKTDSIIQDYDHTLIGTEQHDGKKVYVIKSMPKPDAPVVWGMQRLKIREDHIFLLQEFYDEDLSIVKTMTGSDIQMLGGKLFPKVWTMIKADEDDHYTSMVYRELSFETGLPSSIFTLNNLKRPRR